MLIAFYLLVAVGFITYVATHGPGGMDSKGGPE